MIVVLPAVYDGNIRSIDVDPAIDIEKDLVAAPSPAAPAPAPGGSDGYGSPESKHSHYRCKDHGGLPNRIVNEGWVCRPPPGPVDHCRIVARDIDDLGVYRFDLDVIVGYDHSLLDGRPEVSGRFGPSAESLDRVHDGGLLGEKSLTEPLRPVGLLGQHGEHLRKRCERLNAEIPVHPVEFEVESLAPQPRVRPQPMVGIHHLVRVGCRDKDLCKK